MVPGIPNPNVVMPVSKMCIQKRGLLGAWSLTDKIYVLYNPNTYTLSRRVMYGQRPGLGEDSAPVQFAGGGPQILQMELFFDTFSAGAEAHDSIIEKLLLTGNSLLPSAIKLIDVRKYTDKIYELMKMKKSTHAPPIVRVSWDSLELKCILVSCSQRFTKFTESGMPVRAVLNVVFQEYIEPEISFLSLMSPDVTKHAIVSEGDSLWGLAHREYGDAGAWRTIADANGVHNPRHLQAGTTLRLPALKR